VEVRYHGTNRQTKTGPTGRALSRRVVARKALEQVSRRLGRHSGSAIADRDRPPNVCAFGRQAHLTVARHVPEGVVEKVIEQALQQISIASDLTFRWQISNKRNILVGRGWSPPINHFFEQIR
jgi:hypothetical protein